MSSTHNSIFIPTHGKDESKFKRIPAFESVSNTPLFKEVVSGFRMAGKVKLFINKNRLAVHRFGSDYNGYGYSTDNIEYLLRPKDAKVVMQMLADRSAAADKRKTPSKNDQKAAWCRRLVKLTGISLEDAERIADEKLEAKSKQIDELLERQVSQRYSVKRERLINEIVRSNPLRRIDSKEHAFAILQASVRHTLSDYDETLEEAREMAARGELDYSEIKAYARKNARYRDDVQSAFFSDEDDEDDDTHEKESL